MVFQWTNKGTALPGVSKLFAGDFRWDDVIEVFNQPFFTLVVKHGHVKILCWDLMCTCL